MRFRAISIWLSVGVTVGALVTHVIFSAIHLTQSDAWHANSNRLHAYCQLMRVTVENIDHDIDAPTPIVRDAALRMFEDVTRYDVRDLRPCLIDRFERPLACNDGDSECVHHDVQALLRQMREGVRP